MQYKKGEIKVDFEKDNGSRFELLISIENEFSERNRIMKRTIVGILLLAGIFCVAENQSKIRMKESKEYRRTQRLIKSLGREKKLRELVLKLNLAAGPLGSQAYFGHHLRYSAGGGNSPQTVGAITEKGGVVRPPASAEESDVEGTDRLGRSSQ